MPKHHRTESPTRARPLYSVRLVAESPRPDLVADVPGLEVTSPGVASKKIVGLASPIVIVVAERDPWPIGGSVPELED